MSLEIDSPPLRECSSEGCSNPCINGRYLCQLHCDLVDGISTPATEQWRAQIREKTAADIAAHVASTPRGQAAIFCPHCQVQGRVASRRIKQKKGISGGKATGALLTGGISLLSTGLSRKESATEMHCRNCNTRWVV